MHVAGVQADARTFEHIDPERGRQPTASCWSPSCRARARCSRRAEQAGIELDADGAQARGRAAQGARAPRLPLRGRRRLLRAAAAQGGRRLRAAVPARELPRDHREARGRQGPDRGDDQDLGDGERIVRTAEGNGPVNALDRALRDAIAELLPAPARHRARQLQGADHRRAQGHRRGHAGADRRLRRRRDVGHDRRLGEHHRGELGGAGRLARVRVPAATPSRRAARVRRSRRAR